MKTLEAGVKKKAKKPAAKKPGGKKQAKGDARFARRHSDPRFSTARKNEDGDEAQEQPVRRHLTEKDERFSLARFTGRKVDARGKPIREGGVKRRDLTSKVAPKTLKGYYKQLRKDEGADVSEDDEEEEEVEEPEDEEEEEEDEGLDSDADFEGSESLGSDIYEQEGDGAVMEQPSHRLALRNCDWDNLNAQHFYALFQSFTPRGGALVNVKIYISEHGKKELERERTQGPNLWVKPSDGEEYDVAGVVDSDEDDAAKDDDNESLEEDEFAFDEEDEAVRTEIGPDGEKFSENRYRRYELQRLKYFYAIIEFDSAETAAHVYRECDGTEIERSGSVFDLSFVPDEMEFEDEPKDRCDCLDGTFQANTGFVTNALQNSRFAISWDQTDPKRKKVLASAFAADRENMDDLDAYLAPCASSDDDDDEAGRIPSAEKVKAIRSKYACLFEGVGGLSEEKGPEEGDEDGEDEDEDEEEEEGEDEKEGLIAEWSDEDEEDDVDSEDAEMVRQQLEDLPDNDAEDSGPGVVGDMEGTIHLGAKEGSKTLKDVLRVKEARENETVWEKRLRKKKEGRKQKKKELKQQRKEEVLNEDTKEAVERRRQRLLEVMGEEDTPQKKKTTKKEKRKLHKQQKVAAAENERKQKRESRLKKAMEEVGVEASKPAASAAAAVPEGVDKLMQRFGSKLSDPRFAPDPTHPKFQKDSKEMNQILSEVQTLRSRKRKVPDSAAAASAASSTGFDYMSAAEKFKALAKQRKKK